MKSNVLIIGGFNKAQSLAKSLLQKGYTVTVINSDLDSCHSLAEIPGLNVIHGDGTKPYVLLEANAEHTDIAIALTQRDEDNLVICQLCKKRFRIQRTVAIINDARKTEFFYQMGVDSVVCATSAITNIIEQQAFMDKIGTMVPIGEGRINVAEVPILSNSPAVGKKLWEMNLPGEVIIGCILRGEKSLVPRGDTRVLAGDTLVLISSDNTEMLAIKELTGR